MLITLLISLLISNAVILRWGKSILFSRTVTALASGAIIATSGGVYALFTVLFMRGSINVDDLRDIVIFHTLIAAIALFWSIISISVYYCKANFHTIVLSLRNKPGLGVLISFIFIIYVIYISLWLFSYFSEYNYLSSLSGSKFYYFESLSFKQVLYFFFCLLSIIAKAFEFIDENQYLLLQGDDSGEESSSDSSSTSSQQEPSNFISEWINNPELFRDAVEADYGGVGQELDMDPADFSQHIVNVLDELIAREGPGDYLDHLSELRERHDPTEIADLGCWESLSDSQGSESSVGSQASEESAGSESSLQENNPQEANEPEASENSPTLETERAEDTSSSSHKRKFDESEDDNNKRRKN